MAMLAEKRTKTRYYLHHKTLNPRGNLWCEDNSKFGQRMLEKMGWSEGKGLGAKENGTTDPVHVSYKWDNKGMGYKGADGDEAVAQQKDFDALLATLSPKTGGTDDLSSSNGALKNSKVKSPASLELRSQKSRARVHYHKFTRGKDLSRASSKDLASILGMSMDSKPPAPAPADPVVVPDVGPPIESNMETTFGITTIARGNITEYFKQKYNERKRKMENGEASFAVKKSKDTPPKETDTSISTFAVEETDQQNEIGLESDEPAEKLKRKKKKKSKHLGTEVNQDTSVLDQTVDDTDPSASKGRRKSVTWGDVEVSFVSKYIKEMADTSSESLSSDLPIATSEVLCNLEETNLIPEKKKKKKKDKKKDKVESNDAVDSLDISVMDDGADDVFLDNQDSEDSSSKKKKKKCDVVDGNADEESSNSLFENESNVLDVSGSEDSFSKKKKKKKVDCEKLVETSEDNHSSNQVSGENNVVIKKQKKKKCKEEITESDHVLASSTTIDNNLRIEDNCDSNSTEDNAMKKKKKLKNLTPSGEDGVSMSLLSDDYEKKKRKRIASSEDLGGIQREKEESAIAGEHRERKKKKRNSVSSLDEHCNITEREEHTQDIAPEVVSHGVIVEKKKKRKKNLPPPDEDVPNQTESKKKVNVSLSEEVPDLNSTPTETTNQPVLSALTQSRMAKWKERRQSNDKKSETVTIKDLPDKKKKSSRTVLEVNPGLPTQDYNHRRVLAALGHNVKQGTDKNITVHMPPSNFKGSNLDSIPGYGQFIKSC